MKIPSHGNSVAGTVMFLYIQVYVVGMSMATNVNITAYVGTAITLKCPFDVFNYTIWNGPPHSLVYSLPGSPTFNPRLGEKLDRLSWDSNNRDLIINNLSLADAGEYSCSGTTSFYTIDLRIKDCLLKLNIGTETVKFTFMTKIRSRLILDTYKITHEKMPIILTHIFNGSMIGDISTEEHVMFTGNVEKGNFSFQLTNVSAANSGFYSFGRNEDKLSCVVLYIIGKPTTPTLSGHPSAEIGGTIKLTCSGAFSRTVPNSLGNDMRYNWYIDDEESPIDRRYSYNKATLVINGVLKTDKDKKITCAATEEVEGGLTSNTSNPVSIIVFYGPENIRFDPSYLNYTVQSGDAFGDIRCSADCNPKCSYTWSKNGLASHSQILFLGTIERTEAGIYMCKAIRGLSALTKSLTVNVIYAATVIEFFATLKPTQTAVIINEDDTLDLICRVDSYPGSTINITKGDEVLQHKVNSLQIAHKIEQAKCSDTGTYLCVTQNEHFNTDITTNRSLQVFVTCPPEAVDGDKSLVFAPVHQTVVLNVLVYCYPTPKTFAWYKKVKDKWRKLTDSRNRVIKTADFMSNLTIVELTYENFGEYSVKANNGLEDSLLTKVFDLNEEGKPEEPLNFRCQMSPSKSTSVVVDWEPGLNGGFSQSFVIQQRREEEAIWKETLVIEPGISQTATHVILENLIEDSVYVYRMFSFNIKGNSTTTADCVVAIPGNRYVQKEPIVTSAALAGGIVGGIIFGSVASIVLSPMYHHFRKRRNNKRDVLRGSEPSEQTEVYYNVIERKAKATVHQSTDGLNANSGQLTSEYEELTQRRDEQQYDFVKHETSKT